MKGVLPFDPNVGDAQYGTLAEVLAAYQNGNPAASQQGSFPPMESVLHPMAEILGAILDAGLTPDPENLGQLALAIKASRFLGAYNSHSEAITLTSAQGHQLVDYDTSGGPITQALPDPTATPAGRVYVLRNAASNLLNVTTPAGEIELPGGAWNLAALPLSKRGAQATFLCTGANWIVTGYEGLNPGAEVYLETNWEFPENTFTNIFNNATVAYDDAELWSPGDKHFEIVIPGIYHVNAAFKLLAPLAANGSMALEIEKNGTPIRRGPHTNLGTGTSSTTVSGLELFAAGDEVSLHGFQTTGGTKYAQAGQSLTYAQIRRIA